MKCYVHQDVEAVGTCTNCGKAVCSDCAMNIAGKTTCKSCAEKLAAQCAAVQKKDPIFALVLSLIGGIVSGLFIGLGQVYNGQIKKAIILSVGHLVLVFSIVAIFIFTAIVTLGFGAVCCLPILLVPLSLWIYALYDAYTTAEKINRGEPVKDWLD